MKCPNCQADLELALVTVNLAPEHPIEKTWRDTPLDEMCLSVRSYNCLKNEGCKTAGDVADKTDRELMIVPNFGRKSLREVREVLDNMREGRQPWEYAWPEEPIE